MAFRFAHFLSQIVSIDEETFEVNDPITDDIVAKLFEESNEQSNEHATNKKSGDNGFELPW